MYDFVDGMSISCNQIKFWETPCILGKIKRRKFGENLKVRVPNDPSAIIGLRNLGVETFCFRGPKQRILSVTRWANERRPNSHHGKRRLGSLKTMGRKTGKATTLIQREGD